MMDDNLTYIESVAKVVTGLDWDNLLLELYDYGNHEIIIAVSSNRYTPSRNYLKIYKEVFKSLPHINGLVLPIGVSDYVFVDLSWGQSSDIIEKYKVIAESKHYARCSKSVTTGGFLRDIIGLLSKQRPSPYFDIVYTPDWLKQLGIPDYDLSILSALPCHGDSLIAYLAKSIFVSYSYKRISEIFEEFCKRYVSYFLSEVFLISRMGNLNIPHDHVRIVAKKDFYSHTKTIFECYKPLLKDAEEKRVWHDVCLLCDRQLLQCSLVDNASEIPCLKTTKTVEELERLYKWLKKERHIDVSTTKSEFIHYFRKEPGRLPNRKLLWMGSSKDVLFAVIEVLHPKTVRSSEKKRNGLVQVSVRTNINWSEVSQIIESPNIKIDRINYRSSHRRRGAEVSHNGYEDKVNLIRKIMGCD